MKKIFTLFFSAASLFCSLKSDAQSFTRYKDTVLMTYVPGGGLELLNDNISVPASGSDVTLKWNVISCNFPSDWLANANPGICDNQLCFSFAGASGLWPAGVVKTSGAYTHGNSNGEFHLQLSIPTGSTTGTYYVTARLANAAAPTDTTTATFGVTYMPTAVPTVNKISQDISLYPNPASSEINLVYDANADVKTVAIYSIIGKVMSVYRVSGNSANLNLENIPTGIYFVRLINSNGEVVATRKFTKE